MECNVNNIKYNIIIKRTSLTLINNNNKIIIGLFDIKNLEFKNNKLIIKSEYNSDIIILRNNLKKIYEEIQKIIQNLKYDIYINELIIDLFENKKNLDNNFTCVICLKENISNENIIKLQCCNNLLHYKCYLNYIKSIEVYKCPLCRDTKCPICRGCT